MKEAVSFYNNLSSEFKDIPERKRVIMTYAMEAVDRHYSIGGIMDSIIKGLEAKGKDINALKPGDLASVDEFHTRGKISTIELAGLFKFKPGMKVLDVGCGLGGSARYLAEEYSCNVTGTDLSREYIDTANRLAELVGLSEHVVFKQGNALELPFDSKSFDVVWTEHVQMNLGDKNKFYSEIHRVLNPGGSLIFHDVFQGKVGNPHYPLPWAEEDSISSIITQEDAKAVIENEGFKIIQWIDKSKDSAASFRTAADKIRKSGPPPLGLHLLMGPTAGSKVINMARNLEENRISIVQGVAVKE